jgi:alpha-L-fucosidase
MSDAPLRGHNGRHEWFWEPGDEKSIQPLSNLMEMYYKSVGRNSTLIMGLTPDTRGLLPEPDVRRLKEWGKEIASIYSNKLGSVFGKGTEYLLEFEKNEKLTHIIIQEDIKYGERVRKFIVEGYNNNWEILNEGTCIGHKRIIRIDNVNISKIRLNILESIDEPRIKNFSIYCF